MMVYQEAKMNVSIDSAWKSLNKYQEELCGDKVEILQTSESDIVILADGMGSGVKANILATLTSKILGTMMLEGESVEEAVETLASTLPICSIRKIAYATFSILQIFHSGEAYLVEFDNPSCIFIREGHCVELDFSERNIGGKLVRECRLQVKKNDCFVLMSDGAIYAGVGEILNFGWTWKSMAEYALKCTKSTLSAPRLAAMLVGACKDLYMEHPGDDTTVAVARVIERRILNIFTGPPERKADDRVLMREFMASPGKKVVCGGTSGQIAANYLKTSVKPNMDEQGDIPPTASIEGLDLVTEGVLTLGKALTLLKEYDSEEIDVAFFDALDAGNGAAKLARMIIEDCTELNLFVGRASNKAYYDNNGLFDINVRKNLVLQLFEVAQNLGKLVNIKYY